jgi:hypothetical protein
LKKDFEEVYNNIVQDLGTEFEKKYDLKKYLVYFCILFLICIVIYKIIRFEIAGIIFLIGGFTILYFFMKLQDMKIKDYKNILVSKIVSNYNDKLHYGYKSDITEYEYRKSKFPEKFEEFKTTDQISGELVENTNIRLARVATQKVERKVIDGNVKTEKIETYNGFYAIVNIHKMLKVDMLITSDDFKQKYNAKRIEIDSQDFEKNFDCFADNKIVAMQILTSEVIDKINIVYNNLKKPIQIRINGDMMYFRIFDENLFIPSRVKSILDKSRLEKLYNQIDSICSLIVDICENIYDVF